MSELPIAALLIEPDDEQARSTTEFLLQNYVRVTRARDGAEGLAEALRKSYDVVILDRSLPRGTGLEVCKRLRAQSSVPIIVLTQHGDEEDRLLSFELGADEYLLKPFSLRELLARMRVHVRRARGQVGPIGPTGCLRVGDLELNPLSMRATLSGRDLNLTAQEFNLLKALAKRAGRVLTRQQLLDLSKGNTEDNFERSIDVCISRIRQKLGQDPRSPRMIQTIRGVGYLLAAELDPGA